MHDVMIAGGGPAGLAAAIRSARRGFRTLLIERSASVPDKACGEGLMPGGASELEQLGVSVPGDRCAAFRGIRYLQEDGTTLEARFRGRPGIGIRRTVLGEALRAAASAAGVEMRRASVGSAQPLGDFIRVETDSGAFDARLLLAADGLHSPLRHVAGLDRPRRFRGPLRFGVRRHFALPPWTDFVEVHWAAGVEAYVTPVGPATVNVALLRDRDAPADFADLLARFPALRSRLGDAAPESELRGAGPLMQRARARWARRLALIGDAAGYVDAITGQGLSLAFAASAMLMDLLPDDLSADLSPFLQQYDRRMRLPWLAYSLPATALVALSRKPSLRRATLRSVAAIPGAFSALVRAVAMDVEW
jgi:flavin-dependent dehydrogenase